MCVTPDIVEDNAGQPDLRIKPGKTADQCRRTGCHPPGIYHQNHRCTGYGGNLGAAAVPAGCAEPVEKPHRPFNDGD